MGPRRDVGAYAAQLAVDFFREHATARREHVLELVVAPLRAVGVGCRHWWRHGRSLVHTRVVQCVSGYRFSEERASLMSRNGSSTLPTANDVPTARWRWHVT